MDKIEINIVKDLFRGTLTRHEIAALVGIIYYVRE